MHISKKGIQFVKKKKHKIERKSLPFWWVCFSFLSFLGDKVVERII